MAIFFILIGSDYFFGASSFKSSEDALEMFSTGAWYVLITVFIVPTINGLAKWKKYLFPGTYKSITGENAIEILKTEKFRNPIPVLEERKKKYSFLESENYFYFDGQLIPKKEIEKFKFDYHSSLKRHERYYTYKIILKNGSVIKNVYRELAAVASKYKDNPVTDYLKNYFQV